MKNKKRFPMWEVSQIMFDLTDLESVGFDLDDLPVLAREDRRAVALLPKGSKVYVRCERDAISDRIADEFGTPVAAFRVREIEV